MYPAFFNNLVIGKKYYVLNLEQLKIKDMKEKISFVGRFQESNKGILRFSNSQGEYSDIMAKFEYDSFKSDHIFIDTYQDLFKIRMKLEAEYSEKINDFIEKIKKEYPEFLI